MKNDFIILTLIVLTLSMSAILGWLILSDKPTQNSLRLDRAEMGLAAEGDATPMPLKPGRVAAPAPISTGKAISLNFDGRGNVRYYDPSSGIVTSVAYDGSNPQIISPTKLPGFLSTLWAPNGSDVISRFSTGQGMVFRLFSYDTHQTIPLDTAITSPVFSPDASRIAYFERGTESNGIFVATPNGEDAKKILNTRFTDISLGWPTKDSLSILSSDMSTGLNGLYLLSLDGGLQQVLTGMDHLEATWSPDGTRVLVSFFSADDGKLHLDLLNPSTLEQSDLATEARASQCAWDAGGASVICGVSETPMSPAALENQTKTPQDLYRIDLATGAKKLLYSSSSPKISLGEILVSPTGSYVIFTNMLDRKAYSFKLN